jgi:hypothetical protein
MGSKSDSQLNQPINLERVSIMANAKSNLAIVSASNVSNIFDAIKELGEAIGQSIKASDVINTKIAALRELGVKTLGDTRKDANARSLKDAIMGTGVKSDTAKVYLSYVRVSLESGNPFSTNVSQDKKRADAKKSKGNDTAEKSDAEKMIAALLNVWKMSDVAADVLIEIETAMAADVPLIDAIADVLTAHGEDLGE